MDSNFHNYTLIDQFHIPKIGCYLSLGAYLPHCNLCYHDLLKINITGDTYSACG